MGACFIMTCSRVYACLLKILSRVDVCHGESLSLIGMRVVSRRHDLCEASLLDEVETIPTRPLRRP